MTIKYDLIGASKLNINIHPQAFIKNTYNAKVLRFKGDTLIDCAFMELEGKINGLPDFIEEVKYQFN